ncbi:DUF4388 domain-containing protein [Herpetosiphon llansteffanensis]|uniref:DUF4388 domain-containing protein n=1 Tax=Herpetosiphon llansteffanensis TaxID=2094568 RepID=UPI000D7B9492|nr:DUF4388 domain-containing protein [Herpetosiphon llansteffanensis]
MNSLAAIPHLHDLPQVVETVKRRQLSGRLTWIDHIDRVHLFFVDGMLRHGQVDPHGQIGEDAVDWLLTRRSGHFEWNAADNLFKPAHSINAEMVANFDRLLTIMVEGEILNRPPEQDFALEFFGLSAAPIPKEALIPQPVRRSLVLPPGEHDQNSSKHLQSLPLGKQLEYLHGQRFSGYLYYQPGAQSTGFVMGIVLFSEGNLRGVYAQDLGNDQWFSANQALQHLASAHSQPDLYQTPARLIEACSAIVGADPSRPVAITASKTILQQVVADVHKRSATGAVQISVPDKPTLYVPFYQGQVIGILEHESGNSRLKPMPNNHPLPFGVPNLTLRVLEQATK